MVYSSDQLLFELIFVYIQVFLPLPNVIVILFNDISCDKTHLDEGWDWGLQEIPINFFTISILCDLV